MIFREGEMELDFSAALAVEKPDAEGREKPEGMKFVDFVVEEEDRIILLELKDPSHSRAGESNRREFGGKMKGGSFINHEIVPKARDTYCYLHLMKRDINPCFVVLLLGMRAMDAALLGNLSNQIVRRLDQETDVPWARRYASGFVLLTESNWSKWFPQYPLKVVGC